MRQSLVPSNIAALYFFSSNIMYFGQRNQLESKFFRFSIAQVKIHQIHHVNFEMTGQFLFKSFKFFIVIIHKPSVNFKLIYFLLRTKGPHQSPNFHSHFWVLWWKFAKFLISFFKSQVSFSSIFASLSSVRKDNSSVLL